jgi:ribosomal protein L40E
MGISLVTRPPVLMKLTVASLTGAPLSVNVLTMNVTIAPQPVVIGNESVITVTVMNGTQPVNGARVDLSSTFGAVTPLSGLTTSDGKFLARFKPNSAGFGFLTASVNATGFERSTSSTAIEAASATPKKLSINMSIEPKDVDVNVGANVIILVTDGIKPLSDARINVTCTGGSIVPAYGKTDSAGKFNAKFIPDDAGTYTIAVVATATGFEQASSNAMVDATKSLDLSEFVFWIALIVVIFAILIIGIILFIRKWTRKSLVIVPKKTRIPADGVTKVPIRVQYLNGFRMPKKMRSSVDVELETTSGIIKNVTLPSQREYVDTDLTSSKEFGTVTITAKSGRDITSTEVLFVVDDGSLEVSVSPDSIPADGKSSASVTVKVKDGKGNYVKPLEDMVVEFNTSLGDAVSSVYLPAGDLSANATIFSGDMTGIAVLNASMGNLRGESKIEFRGLPKRFCMNCGSPMTLDASSCPSCNKIPPSGVDTKQCMTCGTVIPEQAQFCHKCGAMQNVRIKASVGGLN